MAGVIIGVFALYYSISSVFYIKFGAEYINIEVSYILNYGVDFILISLCYM